MLTMYDRNLHTIVACNSIGQVDPLFVDYFLQYQVPYYKLVSLVHPCPSTTPLLPGRLVVSSVHSAMYQIHRTQDTLHLPAPWYNRIIFLVH